MAVDVWKLRHAVPWLLLAGIAVFFVLGKISTSRSKSRVAALGSNGHPPSVWSPGDSVPWRRLSSADLKHRAMPGVSNRFTKAEHEMMGHVCVRPVFLRRKKPVIVLASVPGSGNFWTRYLIEQLTGVYTGSIYAESVSKTRMPGGQWRNGSVVVVKAHSILLGDELRFEGTILLLRNPFDATKAEFSREATGKHTQAASVKAFQSSTDRLLKNVAVAGSRFEKLIAFWLGVSNGRPLHILYFEDLMNNLEEELRKLAAFLNVEISDERIRCVLENREGVNRRKHPPEYKRLDPFTVNMTISMNHHLTAAAKILPRVLQYVRPLPEGVYSTQLSTARVGDIRRQKKMVRDQQ